MKEDERTEKRAISIWPNTHTHTHKHLHVLNYSTKRLRVRRRKELPGCSKWGALSKLESTLRKSRCRTQDTCVCCVCCTSYNCFCLPPRTNTPGRAGCAFGYERAATLCARARACSFDFIFASCIRRPVRFVWFSAFGRKKCAGCVLLLLLVL